MAAWSDGDLSDESEFEEFDSDDESQEVDYGADEGTSTTAGMRACAHPNAWCLAMSRASATAVTSQQAGALCKWWRGI